MGDKKSHTGTKSFKLIQAKRLLVFSCLFMFVYAAMMTLWLVWGGAYTKFYRAGAAVIFDSIGSKCFVRFQPSEKVENEIKISFYHRGRLDKHGRPVPLMKISNDIHYGVYIYIAFIVALIVATPISLKRRAWAMFWGMILMHTFLVFRLAILILYIFSSGPLFLLVLSPFWKKVLIVNTQVFTINVAPGYIVAVFIWIFVSLRREDWSKIAM